MIRRAKPCNLFFHERRKESKAKPLNRIRRYSGETEWCVLRTLRWGYFLYEQKVTKESLRGKTRSAPNAEGRVLRSSVFPLRTPFLRGSNERVQRSIDRHGVTGHAKPLIIAAAPMVVVIAGTAIDWHLHSRFACGCGGANEHQYRKSAPEQRQRK